MKLLFIFLAMTGIPAVLVYLKFRTAGVTVISFIGGLFVFAIIGLFVTEKEHSYMEKTPMSFEMELVSGNIICRTFSLPSTLTKYYIDTRGRGSAYVAIYEWEKSTLFGTSTIERHRILKNGVIDIKKVDSCSGFSEK